MKRLKTILQSNIFFVILLIFIIFFVVIKTIVIKYESKITNTNKLEGVITEVSIKDDKIIFILDTGELVRCTYYIEDDNFNTNLLGKKVIVYGKVLPIYNNTIPNTFNYKKYLYNNYIFVNYQVNNIDIVKEENIFYKTKNLISEKIKSYSDDIETYLNIFILGDKTKLNDDLYTKYKDNGIWYLFAISGMHISTIVLILEKLFKKIKYKKILITLFLFYFLFLANYTPSVMRATLFYILKNILEYSNIQLSNIKTLFLVAFIMLLYNPFVIYDFGFQYSFLITGTIMFESKKITGSYFKKILKISLLAFLVSLPITISINYEINILSIFLSILFVPLISIIIFPLCLLTFIIPPLSIILKLFIILLEFLANILYLCRISVVIPKMPFILIIFYYFILGLYFKFNKKKILILLFLLININWLIPKLDKNYYVYFLDVGQGDSSLIISPRKKEVIMIDTGGSINGNYHVSDNVILFLKSLGIKKINLLIISHGDADHAKETLNYLKNYKIDNIILNKNTLNELEKNIKNIGHVVENYKSKDINFLNINDYTCDDENKSSIITLLKIYKLNFLFLGDITKEEELKLIKDYPMKADVIKLAHHGSKTSSDEKFLNYFSNPIAIISSGRNNIYHHPSNEVITTLNNLKIKYYNTQNSGTICFKINQNNYTIYEFAP